MAEGYLVDGGGGAVRAVGQRLPSPAARLSCAGTRVPCFEEATRRYESSSTTTSSRSIMQGPSVDRVRDPSVVYSEMIVLNDLPSNSTYETNECYFNDNLWRP